MRSIKIKFLLMFADNNEACVAKLDKIYIDNAGGRVGEFRENTTLALIHFRVPRHTVFRLQVILVHPAKNLSDVDHFVTLPFPVERFTDHRIDLCTSPTVTGSKRTLLLCKITTI